MISLQCFRKNCICQWVRAVIFESIFPFFQVPNTSHSVLVRHLNGRSSLLFIKYLKLFLSSFSTHFLHIFHKNTAKKLCQVWVSLNKEFRGQTFVKKEMNWKPALFQYLQFVYFVPAVKPYFQKSNYSFSSFSAFFSNKG